MPVAILGITRRGWPHRNKAFVEHLFSLQEGKGHATHMMVDAMQRWEEAQALHLIVSKLDSLKRARERVYDKIGATTSKEKRIYNIDEAIEEYRIAERAAVLGMGRSTSIEVGMGVWDGRGAVEEAESYRGVRALLKAADEKQREDLPNERDSARSLLMLAGRIMILYVPKGEEVSGLRRAKRRKGRI